MNTDRLTRQADIIDSGLVTKQPITIIGCGGIGSHLALALARMGVTKMRLIDPDKVTLENVSSQGFDMNDVGKFKVDVIKHKILRAVGVMIETRTDYVNDQTELMLRYEEIIVCAVDNMESRKVIAKRIQHTFYRNGCPRYFINPSMGAEYMTIDTYDLQSAEDEQCSKWLDDFMKGWFTDDDGVQETCTAKATIYTTLLVGGFVSKIIKDCIMDSSYTKQVTYDIKNNTMLSLFNKEGESLSS